VRQTALAISRCACGEPFGCATHEGDIAPSPGDISICFACARPFRFDDALRPQPTTMDSLSPELRLEVERKQAQIRWFRSILPAKARS
jgi:hypothetical protein